MKTRYCKSCGKSFDGDGRQLYCSAACRAKGKYELEKNRYKTLHRKKKTIPAHAEIERIVLLAAGKGLSYGKFVAKYGDGR